MLGNFALLKKKPLKKYTSQCQLLTIKRIYKNDASHFNVFTPINVNLGESEANVFIT